MPEKRAAIEDLSIAAAISALEAVDFLIVPFTGAQPRSFPSPFDF